MKTIDQFVTNKDSQLQKLILKAQETRELDRIFSNLVGKPLCEHCRVAKLKKSELIIMVENSAWATRLLYAIPDIIKNINTQPEFKEVTSIRYHIEKPSAKASKPAPKKHLSKENEIIWQELLDNLKAKAN
ncbi:MAG: DUF721 domain-containing protein [Gammaproteobacteria bacterium]|nr:DUF721 domain-containing protein [Gammaproteobacteria bacterium]